MSKEERRNELNDSNGYSEASVDALLSQIFADNESSRDLQYYEMEDLPYKKGSLVDLLRNYNERNNHE